MKDDDHPSDYIGQPNIMRPTTTPPAAKISREIFHGLFYIIVLIVSLLANKWELKDAPSLSTVITALLVLNAALRKGEGALDVRSIVEAIRAYSGK